MIRNLSLFSKMLLITIVVGACVFYVLDIVQSRHLKEIFNDQLNERLQDQAKGNRIFFDKYVQSYYRSIKVIATQDNFMGYIRKVKKLGWPSDASDGIKRYQGRRPEWLPQASVLRALARVRSVLLLDSDGRVREMFMDYDVQLPEALLSPSSFIQEMSHNQSLMTKIENKPYLITSETVRNEHGETLAILLLISPLDDDFIRASQSSTDKDEIVALVDSYTNMVIASSRPDILPSNKLLDSIEDIYHVTGKSFFDYGASDLEMQFASLISREKYDYLTTSIFSKERANRAITALVLIVSFSIIMALISRRVSRLTRYVVDSSDHTIDMRQEDIQQGDELQVLKKCFVLFTEKIKWSHERLMEQASSLRIERDNAQNYLDIAGAIILSLNSSGEVMLINKKGCRVLGYEEKDIVGKNWIDIFIPEGKRQETKAFFNGLMTGENDPADYYENVVLTKNDGERNIAWNNTIIKDEALNITGTLSSGVDITGRKRMEAALRESNEKLQDANIELKETQSQMLQSEKMASIGQLAAGVAHEINNPTAFISSNLGTLNNYVNKITEFIKLQHEIMEGSASEEAMQELKERRKKLKLDYILNDIQELIAESYDGTERITKIVQNLKSFSRVDEAEYTPSDINECIESTLNIVWNELKYKATLEKELGDIPLTKCYLNQLNQVFVNLLVNAAQAIETRGVIKIKTYEKDDNIYISISDTGSGISQEKIGRIFEPFFTTKEVGKGTGLGLSIAYDIVQKHNGELSVESEVGKGTTFNMRIPIIK